MKCIYRFKVNGTIRLEHCPAIPTSKWEYWLILEDGLLRYLDVCVNLEVPAEIPRILDREKANSGDSSGIDPNAVHLEDVQDEIKTLQGLLAPFGVRSIEWKLPQLQWVPESEAEQKHMTIRYFWWQPPPFNKAHYPPAPLDLIIRAVLSCESAHLDRTPLNFFRRGMVHVAEQEFVPAFYNFYFVLEYLFGDGKFRSSEVKKKFINSPDLLGAVQSAFSKPMPLVGLDPRVAKEFDNEYAGMPAEEVLERFISIRGSLHHNSSKNKKAWHPEEQDTHALDAYVLQEVVMALLIPMVLERIGTPKVWEDLKKIRASQTGGDFATTGEYPRTWESDWEDWKRRSPAKDDLSGLLPPYGYIPEEQMKKGQGPHAMASTVVLGCLAILVGAGVFASPLGPIGGAVSTLLCWQYSHDLIGRIRSRRENP